MCGVRSTICLPPETDAVRFGAYVWRVYRAPWDRYAHDIWLLDIHRIADSSVWAIGGGGAQAGFGTGAVNWDRMLVTQWLSVAATMMIWGIMVDGGELRETAQSYGVTSHHNIIYAIPNPQFIAISPLLYYINMCWLTCWSNLTTTTFSLPQLKTNIFRYLIRIINLNDHNLIQIRLKIRVSLYSASTSLLASKTCRCCFRLNHMHMDGMFLRSHEIRLRFA